MGFQKTEAVKEVGLFFRRKMTGTVRSWRREFCAVVSFSEESKQDTRDYLMKIIMI